MKQFWYRRQVKIACYLIQGLLAGLIVFCILSLVGWTQTGVSLSEVGQSFENTSLFLSTAQTVLSDKISAQQDIELFEAGGVYAPDKWIDIRQYISGTIDQSSRNSATSYAIADLLEFASSSGVQTMRSALGDALSSASEEEAGLALLEKAAELETILPESGTTLADYVRISANAPLTILDYYRSLCDTAEDIARRYASYSAESAEESSAAPSNLLYYIENTTTRQRYSNCGARTMSEAKAILADMQEMTFLFEGERRSTIMVVDSEHVLNENTSQWFSQNTLTGSNEKIVIAVNLAFPVGDSLQAAYQLYQNRAPLMRTWITVALAALAVLAALLIISIITAGAQSKDQAGKTFGIDRIPTEIETGIWLILLTIGSIVIRRQITVQQTTGVIRSALLAIAYYEVILTGVLSVVRRLRAHTLWNGSVAYYVVLGSRQVLRARKSSQRLMLLYVSFMVLNMVFLMIGGLQGAVMMLTINLAALLYLMRDQVGNENIREGLSQIQAGRLDYRVNVDVLTGESRQLGEAVNEMGEGLQKAVDSMLEGERLKAELITNVSHDLKTPLTSIINYVDLLKREEIGSERSAEYLRILDQKTQRLKALVTDLIEISKISSGNVELHMMTLDLRAFMMQAVGEFEDRFAERQLRTDMQLPGEPVSIQADGEQLWRVFDNLLGNIAKYGAAGSAVRISLEVTDGQVRAAFGNVPAVPITTDAKHLMERFARGDESRTTEGSGLGLSIARSLTEYMGGQFTLEVRPDYFEAGICFARQ